MLLVSQNPGVSPSDPGCGHPGLRESTLAILGSSMGHNGQTDPESQVETSQTATPTEGSNHAVHAKELWEMRGATS